MAQCWVGEHHAADCLLAWLTVRLNDKLSCLIDWLAERPTGERTHSLLTDRSTDWYADLTDRLTGCWHGPDWQMSLQSVGGTEGGGGTWQEVDVWEMANAELLMLLRTAGKKEEEEVVEKERAPCFPVTQRHLMNLCVVCLGPRQPGQPDSYNNLWLSAWHCES